MRARGEDQLRGPAANAICERQRLGIHAMHRGSDYMLRPEVNACGYGTKDEAQCFGPATRASGWRERRASQTRAMGDCQGLRPGARSIGQSLWFTGLGPKEGAKCLRRNSPLKPLNFARPMVATHIGGQFIFPNNFTSFIPAIFFFKLV